MRYMFYIFVLFLLLGLEFLPWRRKAPPLCPVQGMITTKNNVSRHCTTSDVLLAMPCLLTVVTKKMYCIILCYIVFGILFYQILF